MTTPDLRATVQALEETADELQELQLALHGGPFDKYRVGMCLAAQVLRATVSKSLAAAPATPAPVKMLTRDEADKLWGALGSFAPNDHRDFARSVQRAFAEKNGLSITEE